MPRIKPATLRDQRQLLGLTQNEVAVLSKCVQPTVSKAENGFRPSDEICKRMGKVLKCTSKKFDWLLANSIEYPLFDWAARQARKDVEMFRIVGIGVKAVQA